MVGRNEAIFSNSHYDHICNDRILTIKFEFALSPYLEWLSSDLDANFFNRINNLPMITANMKCHACNVLRVLTHAWPICIQIIQSIRYSYHVHVLPGLFVSGSQLHSIWIYWINSHYGWWNRNIIWSLKGKNKGILRIDILGHRPNSSKIVWS